jgi:hypothetical protein
VRCCSSDVGGAEGQDRDCCWVECDEDPFGKPFLRCVKGLGMGLMVIAEDNLVEMFSPSDELSRSWTCNLMNICPVDDVDRLHDLQDLYGQSRFT